MAGRPRGIPKTGGRQPGSKNKRRNILEICEEASFDPFAKLVEIARNDADPNQFNALKELCQYIEPKKKAVEVSGNLDTRVVQAMEGLMSLTEEELLAIAKEEIKGATR